MFPHVLILVLLVTVVVGVILWALQQFPIDPTLARVARVVIIVFYILWLVSLFFGGFGTIFGGTGHPYR